MSNMSKKHKNNEEDEEIFFEPGIISSDEDSIGDEIEMEDDEEVSKDKIKKLKEELKKVKEERQEYLDGWQRSRAEYVNLQKRSEEERSKIAEMIKTGTIESFLPVLDSFDMAFSNKEAWEKVDKNWRTGVEYICNQMQSTMREHGIEEISGVGVDFDPNIHEALETVETENAKEDDTVSRVIQKGYKKDGNIIRPAKVFICKLK